MRFVVTNNINNKDNTNIALISGTKNITHRNTIQINNISNIYSDNLAPIFTDTVITTTDSNGKIAATQINNKFKHGLYITDRYTVNKEDNISYPLWYKHNIYKAAIIDRMQTYKYIEYNVQAGTTYNISIPIKGIIISNTIKVYNRSDSTQPWGTLSSSDYTINLNTTAITINNSTYNGHTIMVVFELVQNNIIIKDKNGNIIDQNKNNIFIEATRFNVDNFVDPSPTTDSITKYCYLTVYSNINMTDTYISYRSFDGDERELINYQLTYKRAIDYTIESDYSISTNKPNTQFFISYDPVTTILRIEKDDNLHKMPWFVNIPDNEVNINTRAYRPTEVDIYGTDRIITIKEPVTIRDHQTVKLSYDPYVLRDSVGRPVNISIINEDTDISNIIIDINEKDRAIIVTDTMNINPAQTYIIYQTQFEKNIPIPFININPYKIYGATNGMTDYVIYMLPESELSTKRSIFAEPVHIYYKYTDDTDNRTVEEVIQKISSGAIASEISQYINTTDIHPIILGVTKVLYAVSPNDLEIMDMRRLGTDIAYDYEYDEYSDYEHLSYTTVGWWWGRPIDVDNIAVVYIRKSTIEKMKNLYYYFDYKTQTLMNTDPNFDFDGYMMEQVIKPKIKQHLRVGSKLILEVVDE